MFFLRQRRPDRYGAVAAHALKPGHPEYERIRREVTADDGRSSQEVLDSIDALIDTMARNRRENARVLAETGGEGEDDEAEAPAVRSLD